ncbi:methyltransferase domain-containing protein [Actinomycetota bacterium]
MADNYTHGHHASVVASHATRTAADSAAYLLPRLAPTDVVLDVGCGPGSITLDLATHVPHGRVVGIEPVDAPLEVARAEAARRGDTTTVFERADVYSLPYEDDSFDVVHAHQVLQHLTDPVAALREMARVCRPGGAIAARDADYEAMTWHPASEGMARWLDLYRRLARSNDAEPDAGRRLRAWALEAGLADVRASASSWCYATEEATRWWGGVWRDRVLQSAFAEQAIERGLADHAELQAISQAWAEWGERPDAWFVIVHGEVLASPGTSH